MGWFVEARSEDESRGKLLLLYYYHHYSGTVSALSLSLIVTYALDFLGGGWVALEW
jgi:hypothetical protein